MSDLKGITLKKVLETKFTGNVYIKWFFNKPSFKLCNRKDEQHFNTGRCADQTPKEGGA